MRSFKTLLLALVLLLVAPLPAQEPSYGETIDVSLVNVEVTVSSRGKPVRGLTRDDFELFEDGVRQEITNFHEIGGPRTVKVVSDSPSTDAIAEADDERFRRRVLLLIDDTHVTKMNRDRALQSILEFINDRFTGGTYDWSIALVGGRGAGLILPQTSDKNAIHSALDHVRRGGSRLEDPNEAPFGREETMAPRVNPYGAEIGADAGQFATAMDAREELLRAVSVNRSIVEAVRAFAGTPGKKIVLIVTGDLGLHDQSIATNEGADAARQVMQIRDTLIREANASNVTLYILNPEGLAAPDTVGIGLIDGRHFFVDQDAVRRAMPGTDNGYMYWVARQTGGALLAGNRHKTSIEQFDEASSSYYSLGYRSPQPEDGRYHRIKIRLKNNARAELRYREGYSAIPRQIQLARALRSPLSASLQNSNLPLSATLGEVQKQGAGMMVPIEAKMPLAELQFVPSATGWQALVEFYVSIFDREGNNIALRRFTTVARAADGVPEGELTHNVRMQLSEGTPHTVIVAVRDQTSDAVGIWRKTVRAN